MIEFCTSRRMVIFIVLLIGLSLIVLAIESFLTPPNGKYPQHPGSQGENVSDVPCWEVENFYVGQGCAPCSEFEKVSKHLPACIPTGFKEMIVCKTSGNVYRSCDKVDWIEARNFYIFESCMAVLAVVSGCIVITRQKYLDEKMAARVQRQIASGV